MQIARVNAPPPGRFAEEYVRPSRPVIFSDLARDWPAVRTWSFEFLRERFADVPFEIAQMSGARVELRPRKGLTLEPEPLGRYLELLRERRVPGYAIARWDRLPPAMRADLPVPAYCEGALEYVSKVWVSQQGTVSPLHFDLSDNLHTVILGTKRFQLFAPSQASRLYPYPLRSAIPYVAQVDPAHPDLSRFPRFAGAESTTVDVHAGETLFIPKRWWHQVSAIEDCVTINAFFARGAWGAFIATANFVKRVTGMS